MTRDSEETGTFQTYLAHGYTRSHVLRMSCHARTCCSRSTQFCDLSLSSDLAAVRTQAADGTTRGYRWLVITPRRDIVSIGRRRLRPAGGWLSPLEEAQ